MLEGLTKLSTKVVQKKSNSPKQSITSFKLDSKITQDVDTLSSFFPKKITSMNLLYRASENNFQVSKFHDKCDSKQHTITILKTDLGNIIGGYTPLLWDKNKYNQFSPDNSMKSFISSLTNKHKLQMIKEKKNYAIRHYNHCGPAFGGGWDLAIFDKANQNNSSYARPGHTYNYNNEYVYDTQESFQKWSGQSSGRNFKIQEWQVYQIVFE